MGTRLRARRIRRGRGAARGSHRRRAVQATASACTPRSSARRTATRSCWRTASPAPSGCGRTRSPTWPSDYRVIAYDHRGHGRSCGAAAARRLQPRPPGRRPRRRARRDAGAGRARRHRRPFDGRHRDHVVGRAASRTGSSQRADAVALINTTTGDLLRNVKLLPVPPTFAEARVRAAGIAAEDLRRGAAGARRRPAQSALRVDDRGGPRRRPRDRRLRLRTVQRHPARRSRRLGPGAGRLTSARSTSG